MPRIFKVSDKIENVKALQDELRRNMFLHLDFNPSLSNQESSAIFKGLYTPGEQQDAAANCSSIYEYFNKNKTKISADLKKLRKIKVIDVKRVFGNKLQTAEAEP